ncbi:hypothetical protein PCANC_08668 [Puccinia coronata f. sp. avenae]|uniref:Uncharacterized protein n=1 Tax=Puccinia coronata f. sp. avenae TaxID=200324 RepID=A0A2N5T5Z1_9BASI|nr:hypothetical protein PCANC_08668 [Puccinia coronata f. sp. avenae]
MSHTLIMVFYTLIRMSHTLIMVFHTLIRMSHTLIMVFHTLIRITLIRMFYNLPQQDSWFTNSLQDQVSRLKIDTPQKLK